MTASSLLSGSAGKPVSHVQLFTAFLKVGVLGFGGVAAWARRIVVEERGWLDEREFAGMLGVASVLPGANTVNMAIMIGDRYCGASGSLAALAGLMGAPLLILAAIASLYDMFAKLPMVQAALAGAAAAAAGLVIGNALKMLRNLKPDTATIVCVACVFVAIGLLRLPMAWTLLVIVPASILVFVAIGRRR